MIHRFRNLDGKDENEILDMINLNKNDVVTQEEFVVFFLVKQSTIDTFAEEAIKRRLGVPKRVEIEDTNQKKLIQQN